MQEQGVGVWIAIGLCNDSIGNEQRKVTNVRELFAYHVKSD